MKALLPKPRLELRERLFNGVKVWRARQEINYVEIVGGGESGSGGGVVNSAVVHNEDAVGPQEGAENLHRYHPFHHQGSEDGKGKSRAELHACVWPPPLLYQDPAAIVIPRQVKARLNVETNTSNADASMRSSRWESGQFARDSRATCPQKFDSEERVGRVKYVKRGLIIQRGPGVIRSRFSIVPVLTWRSKICMTVREGAPANGLRELDVGGGLKVIERGAKASMSNVPKEAGVSEVQASPEPHQLKSNDVGQAEQAGAYNQQVEWGLSLFWIWSATSWEVEGQDISLASILEVDKAKEGIAACRNVPTEAVICLEFACQTLALNLHVPCLLGPLFKPLDSHSRWLQSSNQWHEPWEVMPHTDNSFSQGCVEGMLQGGFAPPVMAC
ncbi:hypothetical protein BDK51DRAFT_28179 [Blyttiomyces helicus]|uniref:Uncharacterized protein n=1 Tax=Blyttiomyces helicus TaxID=388810 RepID=A0A4P9W0I2_9FUNG|nr:hypothetical protein BDK51DRAFT_28179 [Blyttiomyces helicus]|eukprot:RKO84835.1 hypothetical protein BDK51DRAFT_28179 [Blyttiomyces helicus]